MFKYVEIFNGNYVYRYDHLSEVLNKILAERPENVIDFFEEYSRKVKEQRYKPLTDHLKDIYICPMQYEYTKKIMPYLKVHNVEFIVILLPDDLYV